MAVELSKVELDITKEIINIGLSKAADSLSFFIKDKVLIQHLDLQINSTSYAPLSRKQEAGKTYLLTTNILGDINGKSYLVLNDTEVEKFVGTNIPDSIKNNDVEKSKMTDALLLEIDNIITASVVTQFSNILRFKMYGGVPMLDTFQQDQLNTHLNDSNPDQCNVMYFNSRFITKNLDINPEFIWLMGDKFFTGVKNVVKDDKMLDLLQKFNAVL